MIFFSYYNFVEGTLISTFINSPSRRLNHMLEQYGTDLAVYRNILDNIKPVYDNLPKQTVRPPAQEQLDKHSGDKC